jgi:hypothetical protein
MEFCNLLLFFMHKPQKAIAGIFVYNPEVMQIFC